MEELVNSLPSFVWYTALAQIVSNIMHSHENVWRITKAILIRILTDYPSQALWHIMGVVLSKNPEKRQRAQEVFEEAIETSPVLSRNSSFFSYIIFFREANTR